MQYSTVTLPLLLLSQALLAQPVLSGRFHSLAALETNGPIRA